MGPAVAMTMFLKMARVLDIFEVGGGLRRWSPIFERFSRLSAN
jgi:hypothetical protein